MKGWSLHIGVNRLSTKRYRSEAPLYSPEWDARGMAELAQKEGYERITVLLNESATKAHFLDCFSECIKGLEAGDTLLLSFSGHGGQVKDLDGDEADGLDEAWCLYDDYLLDDELGRLWSSFREGVRIVVVSASCHSRTALKPVQFSPEGKGFSPWKLNSVSERPVVYCYAEDPGILASILHLSACDDLQEARDDKPYSRFTGLLLKYWNNGAFEGTYEDLIRKINQESGYLQQSGLMLLGNNCPELLYARPFTWKNH